MVVAREKSRYELYVLIQLGTFYVSMVTDYYSSQCVFLLFESLHTNNDSDAG